MSRCDGWLFAFFYVGWPFLYSVRSARIVRRPAVDDDDMTWYTTSSSSHTADFLLPLWRESQNMFMFGWLASFLRTLRRLRRCWVASSGDMPCSAISQHTAIACAKGKWQSKKRHHHIIFDRKVTKQIKSAQQRKSATVSDRWCNSAQQFIHTEKNEVELRTALRP